MTAPTPARLAELLAEIETEANDCEAFGKSVRMSPEYARALVAELRRLAKVEAALVKAGDAMADRLERVGNSRDDAHLLAAWAEARGGT